MSSAHRARIGKRNTVTIPVAMLRDMGLKPGDLVVLRVEDGQIRIDNPLKQLERLVGSLAYPGMPVLTDEELEAAIHSAREEAALARDARARSA